MRVNGRVRASAAIKEWYYKKLMGLIDEMNASVKWWLGARYKENEKEIVAQDSASSDIEDELKKLMRRWRKRFDEASKDIAKDFVKKSTAHNTNNLKSLLKKAGWTTNLKLSRKAHDKLNALVLENINLIKSIPAKYFTELTTVTMESITHGTITTNNIANSAITSAKIADGTIVNADIANTTITGSKLANNTVTATQLANNAVTNAKIANSAVNDAKISGVAASKVSGLATVAKTGSYNDLTNKPNIPTNAAPMPTSSNWLSIAGQDIKPMTYVLPVGGTYAYFISMTNFIGYNAVDNKVGVQPGGTQILFTDMNVKTFGGLIWRIQ